MPPVDDPLNTITRRDISGGINNRLFGTDIQENQVTDCLNVDLEAPGLWKKRKGIVLTEDLGNDAGFVAFGYNPDGGADALVVGHGTKLESYIGSGTFSERKADFVSATAGAIIQAGEEGEGDVLLVKFDGNNWFRFNSSYTTQDLGNTTGTGSDSPPDSSVAVYFRGRVWILKGSQLFYSDTFPADYSSAFDTASGWYRIPVGEEKAIIALRDQGLVIFGSESIMGLNPSTTPDATDKPEKLLGIGCVAGKSVVQVGDDIFFLAPDGVRALFRNIQDKVQLNNPFPNSYVIKDEIDSINWDYAHKAQAVFFENKYMLAVPTDSSTVNNKVLVFYPAYNSWTVFDGWNVGAWGKVKFNNDEKLYFIDNSDASVYEVFSGDNDNGEAITYRVTSRKENMGSSLQEKVGGEIKVTALATSSISLKVYIEIDEGGFNYLGSIDLLGNALAFPLEFPVSFEEGSRVSKIFQIDSYESWENIRVKIENDDDTEGNEIDVLGYDIIAFIDEYQEEELNG